MAAIVDPRRLQPPPSLRPRSACAPLTDRYAPPAPAPRRRVHHDGAPHSRRLPSSAPPSASAALLPVRSRRAQTTPGWPLFPLPSASVASPSTRLPPGFAWPTRKGTPPLSSPHLIHNFRS